MIESNCWPRDSHGCVSIGHFSRLRLICRHFQQIQKWFRLLVYNLAARSHVPCYVFDRAHSPRQVHLNSAHFGAIIEAFALCQSHRYNGLFGYRQIELSINWLENSNRSLFFLFSPSLFHLLAVSTVCFQCWVFSLPNHRYHPCPLSFVDNFIVFFLSFFSKWEFYIKSVCFYFYNLHLIRSFRFRRSAAFKIGKLIHCLMFVWLLIVRCVGSVGVSVCVCSLPYRDDTNFICFFTYCQLASVYSASH